MIDYSDLYRSLEKSPLEAWLATLPQQIEEAFGAARHGDLARWREALEQLPKIETTHIDLNSAAISAGTVGECSSEQQQTIEQLLRQLHPWRKGPFNLHGIQIDTEWRSDWKWDRLKEQIQPLQGRYVLDIGCGSGYHCWRMAGAGARQVIGIDPTQLYVMQYFAIRHFIGCHGVHLLPLGIEALPKKLRAFDTTFSMGVLYHRRSPIDHLMELRETLRSGGELVLETLVIDGKEGATLLPKGRYAKMRNVWFLPSCTTLETWLQRCGFRNIRLIDVTTTTTEEQRSTEWMQFDSLSSFLSPEDSRLTIEGLPAPKRAIFLALAP